MFVINKIVKLFTYKQATIVACLLLFNANGQNTLTDSLKIKPNVKLSLGVRIFASRFEMGPKFATNIGIVYKPKNNIKYEFFIRNYFHIAPIVPPLNDTSYLPIPIHIYYQSKYNNIRFINYVSLVGFNRYFKNNKYKWGLAAYYSRYNYKGDKSFFIDSGHSLGLENSFYAKYKWVNVAFKLQTQFVGQTGAYSRYVKSIDVFSDRQLSICIEIPINIKL